MEDAEPDQELIPAVGRPSGLYRIVPSSPVAAPAVATETDGRVVPNPVRPGRAARIQWRGAAPAGARVRIVDASGRTVRQLTAGGRTAVLWDGTGPDGRETPAGAYFWTLEGAGAEPRRGRLVRLR